MIKLKIGDFINFIDGKLLKGSPDTEIFNISTDTRTLEKNSLFIPLSGEKFDGHNFIDKALELGACSFICSRQEFSDRDSNVIYVSDPLRAYQKLATFIREKFNIPVIAVTGSNGKTTTKELLYSLLTYKFKHILKTRENFNNEIGVPKTLLELSDSNDCAVLEFAMRGPGEIALLSDIAHPTAGVITTVGEAHIGRLGSRENIAKAKGELLAGLPSDGLAVLNRDNDWYDFLSSLVSCKHIRTFGLTDNADVFTDNIVERGMEGTELDVHFNNRVERVFFPMIGTYNIYNLLASVSVASYLIEDLSLSSALKSFIPPPSGRTRIINTEHIKIIDDTYNSNPLAVRSIIDTMAKHFPDNRKILVLGDMLELGEEEIASHLKVGEWVREYGIDYLFTFGPLGRHTAKAASGAGTESFSFQEKSSLMAGLLNIIKPGDVILVKGSRGMHMEEIVESLLDRIK
ncbi:MAG: UDP-N-acetylmuramoyl-tripeptide--D-alanyl-D-alanine ligase [Candidatus Eremiobacterota bacterium]